ncbi:MAG: Fur family transcriptional regulator [Alphaproteobacteria bacterium]
MGAAEEIASARRLRFTPLRRRVFEIVSQSHRPLGAYEVLAALEKTRRARLAPPTVYRALDFLRAHGFVHRIDSLNAYVTCFTPAKLHRAHFFLCEICGRAAELEDPRLNEALSLCAAAAQFAVERETVEIAGRCRDCSIRP